MPQTHGPAAYLQCLHNIIVGKVSRGNYCRKYGTGTAERTVPWVQISCAVRRTTSARRPSWNPTAAGVPNLRRRMVRCEHSTTQ